jgi:hypothetical protein
MRNNTSLITVAAATLAIFAATNTSVAETGDAKQAEITRAMQAAPDSITKNATFVDAEGHHSAIRFKWLDLFSNLGSWLNSPNVQR